jgi:hypothetical protein
MVIKLIHKFGKANVVPSPLKGMEEYQGEVP